MSSDTNLKQFIDQKVAELSAKWQSSIIMPAYVDSIFVEECNILQFVEDEIQFGPNSHRIVRFCKNEYPTDGGFDGEGFNKLAVEIMKAAITSGFKVAKNGNYKIQKLNIITKKFLAPDLLFTGVMYPTGPS